MGSSVNAAPTSAEHTLRYTLAQLDYALRLDQVPAFRKFVNVFVGQENELFHNHQSADKLYYRYPLVQYKSQTGKATLLGLTEAGTAALNALMQHPVFRERCIEWIGEQFAWTEESSDTLYLYPQPTRSYHLQNYLALNETNYQKWQENPSLAARATLLERCLTAHILKFASAIRWQLPPHSLQVQLLDYRCRPIRAFETTLLGFAVKFRTNLTLPDGIGLGKAVSHGFGIVQADPPP